MALQFLPNKKSFDISNALFLANASKYAYDPAKKARTQTMGDLGFEAARFIDGKDTQLIVAKSPEAILVAFRGTQQIEDWLTNVDSKLIETSIGRVHNGFYSALNDSWNHVTLTINTYRDASQKIWFTGHSLGGALAMLATAMYMDRPNEVGGLYTFGQPRVGDTAFSKKFNSAFKDKAFRFVNNNDIVPRVPPRAMGYADTGQFRYFNIFGQMYSDPTTWRMFLDSVAGSAQRAMSRYNELSMLPGKYLLMDGIDDHGLDHYIGNIRKNIK